LEDSVSSRRPAPRGHTTVHHNSGTTIAPPNITIASGKETRARLIFREFEDGSDIAASVTVVWSGPNSDNGSVKHFLKTLHDKLMSACNETEVVAMVEDFNNICAK
jgi:hypothetical protein